MDFHGTQLKVSHSTCRCHQPSNLVISSLFYTDDLFEYFARFGVVSSTSIKYDALSGNPRGFGFVVFRDAITVDKVLNRRLHRQHWIRGRPIEPKRAKCRPMSKKVFVGGIDYLVSEEAIRSHFEKFGKVGIYEL